MRKEDKKAQFYLIAAVIIAVVLLGLFATTNYIRLKPKDVKFYDLSKELGLESGFVIDYGIYSEGDLENLVEQWAATYVDYSNSHGEVAEWIFVYGDEKKITILYFTGEAAGEVSINIGGTSVGLEIPYEEAPYVEGTYIPPPGEIKIGDKIKITAPNGLEYEFTLQPGENFYFVISKEGGVVTPGIEGAGEGE